MDLETPVGKLPMIGSLYERRLARLDIVTVEDLLLHLPFRYEDYSIISKIAHLQAGETVTIQGTVISIKNEFARSRRFIQKAQVSDDSGTIDVVWFNQTYLTKTLPINTPVSLSGKVDVYKKKLALVAPAYEIVGQRETIHTGRLVPIYPETYGVSSKWLRTKIKNALLLYKGELTEYLPNQIVAKNNLLSFEEALNKIHFPQSLAEANLARERLAFDEFFLMQLRSILRKKEWEQKRKGQPLSIARFKREITTFWQALPFELTNAQKRAVREIFADLSQKKPMNRLLEGDVGSGKTVVAAIAMYITVLNGYQAILMAPTQILAQQHFETISSLLTPLGVKVGLITGSSKYHVSGIKNTDIIIGTHALLTKSATLDLLAFIVIDEQHRFGVEQRGLLVKQGRQDFIPHVLTMTATPIPRTVALTLYGNLDLSYLDEMPKGRITVKTWVVSKEKRDAAYGWIKSQISNLKSQIFIICPFIEESESQATVKAATKEYEYLRKAVFQKQKIGLLHGKMKAKDKQLVMEQFRKLDLDILVATPVVEVGIDIPGASIILIEGSERFGLATLHQLRGRVGRGDVQSYCLLFTDSHASLARLKNLERMHVGAELSELDLRLRGPGELVGTKQHGIPKLRAASFSDHALIEKTKSQAQAFLAKDPALRTAARLKEILKTYTMKTVEPN